MPFHPVGSDISRMFHNLFFQILAERGVTYTFRVGISSRDQGLTTLIFGINFLLITCPPDHVI